jgi:hypothetical protein
LRGPSPATSKLLVAVRTDPDGTGRAGAVEYMRRDERGRPIDTQNRLLAYGSDPDGLRRRDTGISEPPQFGTWGGSFGGFFGSGPGAGSPGGLRPQPGGRPNWGREHD